MPSETSFLLSADRVSMPATHANGRPWLAAIGNQNRIRAISPVCRLVRQLTGEMALLAGERSLPRRDLRRTDCHIRQIAMYVCHVGLGISMSDIGPCFGRDRTTVSHACQVVEDRRDEPAFDEFVASVERLAASIVHVMKGGPDE